MIEPMFAGKSVFDFDHIEARIRNSMYHLGVGNQLTACLAAINVALFDAIARGFGVRVCDLIGGCGTTRIPAYASTGFFSDDPDRQLAHMLAEAAGHPYAGAKIKIGRGIKSDVERVRQSREALGPDKLLLVDINGAYTPDVALECARAIEPFGIHWIEEPLPPGDLRGYAELRARSPIPIAAGEAHHTVRDFRALIDGRCIDIVQPSIPTVGGLTEAKRIATLAQAANLRVAPHVWGGAVGLATACHFIAALPASPHTDHPPWPQMLEYDMSDNALRTQLLKSRSRSRPATCCCPRGRGSASSSTLRPSSATGFADGIAPCQSFARQKTRVFQGESRMGKITRRTTAAGAAPVALGFAGRAMAQDATVKIGVIYPLSGNAATAGNYSKDGDRARRRRRQQRQRRARQDPAARQGRRPAGAEGRQDPADLRRQPGHAGGRPEPDAAPDHRGEGGGR